METFATAAIALYTAHHVGDYWVQTHTQAMHKGAAGRLGQLHCLAHVLSYLATAVAVLAVTSVVTGLSYGGGQFIAALAVSGVTHYMADRREYGPMFWLARRMPWKTGFLELGTPRRPREVEIPWPCESCHGTGTSPDESTGGRCWDCKGTGTLPGFTTISDNPQLATGAWALDQSWHIFWGVFVAALVLSI